MNEDRLRQHLADKAASVEVTPGNPEDLKARSANPLVVMGAGLALVTLFGLGLAWLLPASDGEIVASDTTVATVEIDEGRASPVTTFVSQTAERVPGAGSTLPAITAGDGPTLAWQSGQFPADVWVQAMIATGDGFLAWGQERDFEHEEGSRPPFLLWQSADGLEWTGIESEGFGVEGDFWIQTMLATDDRLIAVGMAFDAPAEGRDPVDSHYGPTNERIFLLTSTDGVSWERTEFETQLLGPTDNPGEYWSSSQPLLAAQGDLVVMLTTQTLDFDPYFVIEERLAAEGLEINGLGYGSDGIIEVFGGGEGEDVIATFTAEELGLDPDYFERSGGPLQSRSSAFVSTDGGATFESRDTTGLEDIGYLNSIVTTADGFVVSGEQAFQGEFSPGLATWRSSDGVGWAQGEPLAGGWLNDLNSYGDFIVGAGADLVVSFDAGATFNRVEGPAFDPVDDLEFQVEQAKTGAFGTIAVGSAWRPGPPPQPLEVEADGLIYREVYPDDFNQGGPTVTVTDAATGEIVFSKDNFWEPEYITYGDEGDEFMTFLSPETGEVLMTVSWQEFDQDPFGSDETTIERDGLRFTIDFGDDAERIPHVVITDTASGEVLFDVENVFSPSYILQDDEGFAILDEEGGSIMHISYEQMERSYEAVEFEEDYQGPEMAIWFSPDGRVWSRQSMTEAFGDSGYAQAMASGADRVIVTIEPHEEFYPETEEEARTYIPPPIQVWVGTLP